jgi:glycosyltransferase involved in cell wall biosynthesis
MLEAPPSPGRSERTLVIPIPVAPSGPAAAVRDVAAITYGANPAKKGLDRVLAAWRSLRAQGRAGGEELLVAGVEAGELITCGLLSPGEPGVRVLGTLAPAEYRALLRRARVFICAPRREDYGAAQLEALADGCMLVSTAAPGPYAALPIARELDPRLIGDHLTGALRAALEEPSPGYAERALRALAPFSPAVVDRLVAERLLPRLLG